MPDDNRPPGGQDEGTAERWARRQFVAGTLIRVIVAVIELARVHVFGAGPSGPLL